MMNIFVAKLDFGISSEQLRQEFERYGKVLKATVALDRETGKSRGFAFVEMASKEEGIEAIKALDGKIFNGRPCTVKEADPRPDKRNNRDANRPSSSSSKREDSPIRKTQDSSVEIPPVEISLLNEQRKKVSKDKDKKGKMDWDSDGFPKKTKQPGVFKSKSRFDDFDDEDDDDLNLLKLRRELEQEEFDDEDDD